MRLVVAGAAFMFYTANEVLLMGGGCGSATTCFTSAWRMPVCVLASGHMPGASGRGNGRIFLSMPCGQMFLSKSSVSWKDYCDIFTDGMVALIN